MLAENTKIAFNEAMVGTGYKVEQFGNEPCIMRDGFCFRTIPRGNGKDFLWRFAKSYGSPQRAKKFDNLLVGISVEPKQETPQFARIW